MTMVQSQAYCSTCQRKTLHQKEKVNHVLHLLLSIITGGLWLFVWIAVAFKPERPRCSVCGSKPGLASAAHETGLSDLFSSKKKETRPPSDIDNEIPPSTWLPPGAAEPRK